jgi:hypothetical protein
VYQTAHLIFNLFLIYFFSFLLSLKNQNLSNSIYITIFIHSFGQLWFVCNGSVTGKLAMVDLSGSWMTSLVADSSHGISYFYTEYMAAQYNFFKKNEFAPIESLIGLTIHLQKF